jgi:hypothetical protein
VRIKTSDFGRGKRSSVIKISTHPRFLGFSEHDDV